MYPIFMKALRFVGINVGNMPKPTLKAPSQFPTPKLSDAHKMSPQLSRSGSWPKKAETPKASPGQTNKNVYPLPAVVISHHPDGRPKTAERATRSGFSCRARVRAIFGDELVLEDNHGIVFRRVQSKILAI